MSGWAGLDNNRLSKPAKIIELGLIYLARGGKNFPTTKSKIKVRYCKQAVS